MFIKAFKFSWNLFKCTAVVTGSVLAGKAAWKSLVKSFNILADDIDGKINKVKEA